MRTIFFIFAFTFIVCQYTSDAQGGLDKLRANIPGEPGKDYPTFGASILCKINPRNPGCGGSGGGAKKGGGGGGNGGRKNGNGNKKKNGGASRKRQNQNGNRASSPSAPASKGQNNKNARNNKGSNTDYAAQAKEGNIPGTPGKDYPVNSLAAWRKRPGYENIELAPADLVVAGYPYPNGKGGGGGGRKNKKAPGATAPAASPSSSSGGSGYCPGGSLQGCIGFCPSDPESEFTNCVTDCGNQCPT